jgi:hypothetical protein
MATPFDAAAKELVEMAPADWLAFLGQPRPPELVHVIDADLSATVTTATDKVIRVDDPEPWLLLIELQAGWDGNMPFDLLRRYALLRHRHRMPVSCAIVLLRPEANTSAMTGTFPQPNRLGADWEFPFHVVRVWETPAEALLHGPLGMAPLAPVSAVDQNDLPRVLLEVHARAYREVSRARADTLWQATLQLLALRYDEAAIDLLKDTMTTLDVSNTAFANLFRSEGRNMGRVEEARDSVLAIGNERFGPAPVEVEQLVQATSDLDTLHQLRNRLLRASGWRDLLTT